MTFFARFHHFGVTFLVTSGLARKVTFESLFRCFCENEVRKERRYPKMHYVIVVDPSFDVSLSLMSSFVDVVMTVVVSLTHCSEGGFSFP